MMHRSVGSLLVSTHLLMKKMKLGKLRDLLKRAASKQQGRDFIYFTDFIQHLLLHASASGIGKWPWNVHRWAPEPEMHMSNAISCGLRGKKYLGTVLALWAHPGIYTGNEWRGSFRGSGNKVKPEIEFQHRGTWRDRLGSGEVLRRQKCKELEGLRECCEVWISVQPEVERIHGMVLHKEPLWPEFQFWNCGRFVPGSQEERDNGDHVQWEIMRLWTKQVAERTMMRGRIVGKGQLITCYR